jgi:small subunit ribosomal protein S14
MAKKSSVNRDNRRKKLIVKYRAKRDALLEVMHSPQSTDKAYLAATKAFRKIPRDAGQTRLNRRCNQCGRPRAVYRRFGLCRLCLRNTAMRGDVPGLAMASW